MSLGNATPTLSGVGPFEEKLISIDRAVVKVATSLEYLPAKGDGICVSVGHSFQDFDFIIQPLRNSRCES